MPAQLPLLDPAEAFPRTAPGSITFALDTFRNKNYLTHNFHPYPAKFVPQLPRRVIEALTERGETILDPFCGSGTTLVEANILGRRAVGFDLNPLAGLISRVKTTPLASEHYLEVNRALDDAAQLQLALASGVSPEIDPAAIPSFRNRDHWFQSHVQVELARLKQLVWQAPRGPARDFLKVAFSAIIVKVSNQDSDTRWVAVEKNIERGAAIRAFIAKARDMIRRIEQFGELRPAGSEVFIQSITGPLPVTPESIDLVVTSPPYLNSYDYYLYHKLRFFWLGLDHYPVQAEELGSRNRHCDKGEGIETYTSGILAALEGMYRALKPGKILCLVIGDSVLKGRLVEMSELYLSLCERAGFSFVHQFSFDQRKYTSAFNRKYQSISKRSHIMFFRRRGPCR